MGNYTLNEINHKIIQAFLLELSKNGRKDNTGGLSEKTIKYITIIIKGINEGKIKHIELSINYPKDNKEKIYTYLQSMNKIKLLIMF